MIEQLKYRFKIAKLFRQKEKASVAYFEKIRKAKRDKMSSDDIQVIELDAIYDDFMLDDEIAILATENIIKKARRLFVHIPSKESDGMWKECMTSKRRVLTDKGISQLRSSLRKERNERYEIIFKLSALFIGIIGAITGLVAVIMK